MKCHAKAKKRSWRNHKSYIDRILVPQLGCGKVNGQHLKNLRPAWVRVRATAGLSDVRLHDLRCTVGSWLVREGSSLHLVGAVLDHKDPKTTAGHAYFQIGDRQAALDQHGQKVIDRATHRARIAAGSNWKNARCRTTHQTSKTGLRSRAGLYAGRADLLPRPMRTQSLVHKFGARQEPRTSTRPRQEGC
jgi:hypothetical protein